MHYIHTAAMQSLLGVCCLLIVLSGCTAPVQNLKPIAEQNQQNINTLAVNVDVLLSLYEPLLKASTQSLIYQRLAKTEQEMISVVGPAMLPAPRMSWEKLFTRVANRPIPRREKYLERFRWVKSAVERGVSQVELDKLKRTEGWIYTAAADPKFTPAQAHDLVKRLNTLAKNNRDNLITFYTEAELQLSPYDPKVVYYRQVGQAAQQLLDALKQEIGFQLATANLHSQAIVGFTDTENNPTLAQTLQAASGGMSAEELTAILDKLSDRYLDNPSFKDGAIDLLTQGLKRFLLER